MGTDGWREDQVKDVAAVIPDRAELLAQLEGLDLRATEVLARKPLKSCEVVTVAAYIAEIRGLLVELSGLPVQQAMRISPQECRALAGRFLDLEGRVKELRNDLTAEARQAGERRN